MINTYKLINFEIKTENLINNQDYKSIIKFDNWYEHLNNRYSYFKLKERYYYSNKLTKIVNIQSNILSEILFIIERYGEHRLSLIK